MNDNFDSHSLIDQKIYTKILNEVNHDQIASDINLYAKNIEQETPGYGHISRGFVQYEDLVLPITPEIKKLENCILLDFKNFFNKEYRIDDTWAVRLVENQSVIAHSHYSNHQIYPEEYYSIAYYPSVPDSSAELIFSAEWCGIMKNTFAVKPRKGLLVIFNSYITHMTARHKITEPRLVISMNLSPVNPKTTPNADWSVYWDRPIIDNPKLLQ